MKQLLNSFFFFYCIVPSIAQIDVKFIKHLSSSDLRNEHRTYLNLLPPATDSIHYFKARFNLQYGNDSLFLQHYSNSKALCNRDTFLFKKASVNFLKANDIKSKEWFNSFSDSVNTVFKNLKLIYNAAEDPNTFTTEVIPYEAQKAFKTYKKAYNKKPILAAALSTFLPGAGKLYAGKTKTFFLAFLLSAGYAAQTIESANRLGITHPLTFINAGAFAIFYFSNIYGSYRAVIDLKQEHKKQFISDATNFYN